MKKNIIITGLPESGKSTTLNNVILHYSNKTGFVTNEVREEGKRVGFKIKTQKDDGGLFAGVKLNTDFKVSRYFVDIKKLDSVVSRLFSFGKEDLLYIDEVGEMQCKSELFKKLVFDYLNSKNISIITLSSVYTDDFINSIKLRNDIILVEISKENREEKLIFVKNIIEKVIKAKRYLEDISRFDIEYKITARTDHGVRHLVFSKGNWACDCEFYEINKICSHIIAVDSLLLEK